MPEKHVDLQTCGTDEQSGIPLAGAELWLHHVLAMTGDDKAREMRSVQTNDVARSAVPLDDLRKEIQAKYEVLREQIESARVYLAGMIPAEYALSLKMAEEKILFMGSSLFTKGDRMPEKKTLDRARVAARKGKSPSTQAGEFVREEIEHIREGKHGARSARQAIAIGLSKARRAGVKLPPPKDGSASPGTRKKAKHDVEAGKASRKPSAARSRASRAALKREGRQAASPRALSRHSSQVAKTRAKARNS